MGAMAGSKNTSDDFRLGAALASHNPILASEHKHLLTMSKKIRLRLVRIMEKDGKRFEPTPSFMTMYDKLARNLLRLIAEGRQLEKSRAADDMSDDDLHAELRPIIRELLRELPMAERMKLIAEPETDADGQHAEH